MNPAPEEIDEFKNRFFTNGFFDVWKFNNECKKQMKLYLEYWQFWIDFWSKI
jgi:hypothetical protein